LNCYRKLVLACSLCAATLCANAADVEQQPKKELLVGCEGAFAPFTYIDDSGNIIGFDIDLIRAIGKSLGYENTNIRVLPFDGLIPALMTGNIDVIISGFTITPERDKKVDFSDPYYLCGLTYLVDKKDAAKYDSYEKLDGEPICLQIGTTGAMFTEKFLTKSQRKVFNSPPEAYIELGNGGCRAVIHDMPVNDFFLAKNTSDRFETIHIGRHVDKEYYGIAVREGDKHMLDEMNRGLKLVQENGEFERISKDWFGHDIRDTLKE
jgi:glutamine transport system substrate-binding protein